MATAALCGLSAFGGALMGAIGLFVWLLHMICKPAFAQEVIKRMHSAAKHEHWLQHSPEDPARVCPSCGWEEQPRLPIDARALCGIKVVTADWAQLDTDPGDIVGTEAELEPLVRRWRESRSADDGFMMCEIRPYTGKSPARPELVEAFRKRIQAEGDLK